MTNDTNTIDTFFQAPSISYKKTIDKAPEEISQRLAKQDDQINQLQSVLGDINLITDAITNEQQRQTNQLEKVHDDMDKAIKKAHVDDFRVKKLL
jgi:septal ring factor EnvC (AmiA/AmiB activator)